MNFGIGKGISSIDSAAINEVAGKIFANAAAKDKPTFTVDYAKFNRAEQGVDLYSERLNIEQTQQISVRNAGLDTNFDQNRAILASVNYLNKVAAFGTYGVVLDMNGKIHMPEETKPQDQSMQNRKSNNPFNYISFVEEVGNEQENPF